MLVVVLLILCCFLALLLQAEQALDEDVSLTTPIWQVSSQLHFRVTRVAKLLLPRKRGLLSPLPSGEKIHVTAQLYHGLVPLCAPMSTTRVALSESFSIMKPEASGDDAAATSDPDAESKRRRYAADVDAMMIAGIAFKDLPRAARVIFTVYSGKTPVAWAGCNCVQVLACSSHASVAMACYDCVGGASCAV